MYKHLSKEERYLIEQLMSQQKSNREIAKLMGRSASTISREIFRNWKGEVRYDHDRAQKRTAERRKLSGGPKIGREVWAEVFRRYNEDHSPEQIAGALQMKGVRISHETIYQRIYREIESKRLDYRHLRWFRKKRQRRLKVRQRRDSTKISIERRPPKVAQREEFGHWEGDTVQLQRGAYLVTLVERKTRFLITALVPNKQSNVVREAIEAEFRHFPKTVRSITFDNGTEFAQHQQLAKNLSADIFFAHPYSPWERGSNENTNRLLRQYFPKTSKSLNLNPLFLADARQKINTRPRKCLAFASPAQAFFALLKSAS